MEGIRGSRISSSRMRHRKRSVTPLMYSLGCCRLLRRFWHIRICRPPGSHNIDSDGDRCGDFQDAVLTRLNGLTGLHTWTYHSAR